MSYHSFLDVTTVRFFQPLASACSVLRSRGAMRQFVDAYQQVQGHQDLPEKLKVKRAAAIDRLLAVDPDAFWWAGGLPNRAHLSLIMWAYSPTPMRLARFVGGMRARTQERSEET